MTETQQTTLAMVTSANRRARILRFLNSLALAPKRVCRTLHCCQLCACPITIGQEYRDRGVDRRAHEECYLYVVEDFRKREERRCR